MATDTTANPLREHVRALLDIIHDDLTHAAQRHHAEAINAAAKAIDDGDDEQEDDDEPERDEPEYHADFDPTWGRR
jgi:hypothetical protein